MLPQNKGLLLVLFAGLVSGIAIFVNKFAITDFNPFTFTFLKNSVVAILLLAVLVFVFQWRSFRALTKKQWGQLALIGLTGGSIAFLLFFFALQNTSAITAGFLHKTIFIFATILAVVFLKEKINKKFLLGGILLFAGNFLVFSALESFSIIDLLVVAAVVLWAIENTFAKKVLKELSGLQVAFGRIFFGTLFMLPILFFSNNLPDLALLSWQELQWVLIASGFLFLFVASYYSGLKYIPVSRATALLLIGQPITAILSLAFLAKAIAPLQALGFLVLLGGIALVTLSLGSVKKPVLCVDRALQ